MARTVQFDVTISIYMMGPRDILCFYPRFFSVSQLELCHHVKKRADILQNKIKMSIEMNIEKNIEINIEIKNTHAQ